MQTSGTQQESATAHGADAGRAESTDGHSRVADRERRVRGQTTLDFAVGMSLFLVSLTFIMLFVPGMLGPFVGGTQDEIPASNRVADDLATRLLGNASEPYALDAHCTQAFFKSATASDCEFDGTTIEERVGVKDRMNVNVTVLGNTTGGTVDQVLCWDATNERVVERDDASCGPNPDDVVLARGSNLDGSGGKTVSARRVALLDGRDVTIEVVMW
jgi:hypothetical protein